MKLEVYTPHPKQSEAHASGSRYKVLNWGRRTGKSTFAANHTLICAHQVKGRYWIVAPTYRQVKNIYWRDIIDNEVFKTLIDKKNEAELTITLKNGSVIELKGAENEDSLRGAGIKGLILDEYAFMSPGVWERILQPALADSKGWAIFISTPNGFNHFYEISTYAQKDDNDWFYSHATSYDNAYMDNEEIDEIRKSVDENTFAQEYLGEFRKMTGLVYKDFDREIHIVKPSDVPSVGTHCLTVDFGYTNPLGALFVVIDYDNNWWVYDEIYKSGLATEQAVNMIQSKMGANYFNYQVGDSAAAGEIANFNSAGLPIKPCSKTKDSIQNGIRLVAEKLKVKGNGKPSLYISENCENLIFEMESYHYPESKMGKNDSENPEKENDHLMDALRYLALTVTNHGKAKIFKPAAMVRAKNKTRLTV